MNRGVEWPRLRNDVIRQSDNAGLKKLTRVAKGLANLPLETTAASNITGVI